MNRADTLGIGRGQLDLNGFVRGTADRGIFGAALDYSHRVTERASLFGQAELGKQYGAERDLYYQAVGGLRMRF